MIAMNEDPYWQHFWGAKKRGIDWEFTRTQWYEMWGDLIGERGKGPDKYCMARKNDEGPYSPENCYITLFGDNVKEPQVQEKRKRTRAARPKGWQPVGGYGHLRDRQNHPKRRPVIAPDGTLFPSIRLAHETTGLGEKNIERWSKTNKNGWSMG